MAKRKIVCIDEERCNGCGQCVTACAEGAIELQGDKARLVAEKYCDGLAACLGKCPQDAISIIEREADSFDPEAVEKYLSQRKHEKECAGPARATAGQDQAMPCGCLSGSLQTFGKPSSSASENDKTPRALDGSELTHWPIQIKLIPPTAPFLRNADLLVVSDCTPAAYPHFHEDLLRGKVLMIGCPKFDDTEEYIDKFTQIFSTVPVNSVTIAIMEVPCCSRMPVIITTAMQRSDKKIPVEIIVISSRGEIVDKKG